MKEEWKNKNYLIVGGTSDIGIEICKQLDSLGTNLFLCGRSSKNIQQVINLLGNKKKHTFFRMDLDKRNLDSDKISHLKNLDGYIYCAGMNKLAPLRFLKEDNYYETFNVNSNSFLWILKLLIKNGILNDGSSTVAISSIFSNFGKYGNVAYSASKSSLESIVRVAAIELAQGGNRVNSISPGFVKTKMHLKERSISNETQNKIISEYPLGVGTPKNIADAVIFLLSNESTWITGTNLIVDGGRSCC